MCDQVERPGRPFTVEPVRGGAGLRKWNAGDALEPGCGGVAARDGVAVARRPEEPQPPARPGGDADVLDPGAARDRDRLPADPLELHRSERGIARAVGEIDAAGAGAPRQGGAPARPDGGWRVRAST